MQASGPGMEGTSHPFTTQVHANGWGGAVWPGGAETSLLIWVGDKLWPDSAQEDTSGQCPFPPALPIKRLSG